MNLANIHKTVLENMNAAVYVRDLDMNIIYMNKAAETLSGYTLPETKYMKCYDVFGDRPLTCRHACPAEKVLNEKEALVHHEGKMTNRGGDTHKLKVSISPVIENGLTVGSIFVLEDITKLEVIEKTHVKTLITLEKEIENRKMAEQTATSANHAKSMFLANLSHELRTELNAIAGFSELLIGKKMAPTETSKGYFEKISKSSDRLLLLIQNAIDLSKIDAGESTLFKEKVNIDLIIQETLDSLAPKLLQKHATVSIDIDPDLLELCVDKSKFLKILANLLTNAIKFGPENQTIVLTAKLFEISWMQIEIKDCGIGIPPENQPDIFREFYQVNCERDRKHGGIGIGLALSKRLVELHGGSIGFQSELDKGSSFWFKLPIK